MKHITPEQQITNLLDAAQRTANLKPYNGQLEDIRKQLEYIREQFTLLQAGELKPMPMEGDPFMPHPDACLCNQCAEDRLAFCGRED